MTILSLRRASHIVNNAQDRKIVRPDGQADISHTMLISIAVSAIVTDIHMMSR